MRLRDLTEQFADTISFHFNHCGCVWRNSRARRVFWRYRPLTAFPKATLMRVHDSLVWLLHINHPEKLVLWARNAILYFLCFSLSLSRPIASLCHLLRGWTIPRIPIAAVVSNTFRSSLGVEVFLAYSDVATLLVTQARPTEQTFIHDLKLMFRHRMRLKCSLSMRAETTKARVQKLLAPIEMHLNWLLSAFTSFHSKVTVR